MKPKQTVDFHIRWAWQKIAKLYNIEAIQHDFTMAMGYVLLNIDVKAGTPSTKLGPKMGMEPRSISRLLNSMEEKKLITRIKDKTDKRLVRIQLTELGKKKRDISRETVIQFNQSLIDQIGKEKFNSFIQVATQINEILDENKIFNPETA